MGEIAQRDSGEPVAAAATRAQLAELLRHATFRASPRRRKLLAYIVEQTLAGRGDRLKAFDLALAVLGRDDRFDPQNDPIVRIEVGRLRRDLDDYYQGPGRGDPIRISIPKGRYVAAFEARTVQPAAQPGSVARRPDELGLHLGAAGLLAVLIGLATWFWAPWQDRVSPQRPGPAVIVRPLEALTGGEGGQLLANGLTTGLIADLTRYDGLQVFAGAAPTSGPPAIPPAVAGGPVYVIAGEVGRRADHADVTVYLTDARSGEVLWSESYDRDLSIADVFGVQRDLAAAVAGRLAQNYGVITSDAARRLEKDRPDTLFAYDCVQRALAYRKTFDDALYPKVRSCLEEAVRRDPGYAAAWAMLAFAHLDAIPVGDGDPALRAAELRTGLQLARHAVELAPESVTSLQALAALLYWSGDVAEAERVQRQAIGLNPNDPESLALLGWRLNAQGRHQEGADLLQRALDRSVSPPPWVYANLAFAKFFLGDYPAAREFAQRGTAPCCGVGYAALAVAEAALGHAAAARAALDEALRQAPALGRDPHAFWAAFGATGPVIDRLDAGLADAGLVLPVRPADSPQLR